MVHFWSDWISGLPYDLPWTFTSAIRWFVSYRHTPTSECTLSELHQNLSAVKENLYFRVGLWGRQDCKSYPLYSYLANAFWLLSSFSIPPRKLKSLPHAFQIMDLNCEYKKDYTERMQFGQDALLLWSSTSLNICRIPKMTCTLIQYGNKGTWTTFLLSFYFWENNFIKDRLMEFSKRKLYRNWVAPGVLVVALQKMLSSGFFYIIHRHITDS